MYVGSYDAPVRDLGSYSLRLEELALLGFGSVGLAIDLGESTVSGLGEERDTVAGLVSRHGLELRFHPDLGDVARLAAAAAEDLLVCARRQLEPIVEWALYLGVTSICCDSIRPDMAATVAVFRLLVEMTRGTQLQLGVENSQQGVINDPDRMNEAVARVDDPRMGVLLDVGHIHTTVTQGWNRCSGPANFIGALDVPIWDTHFHTNDGSADAHLPVTDPSGTLDVPQVVEALRERGYAGPLNLECARKGRAWTMLQMEQAVQQDRAYLESLVLQGA